MSIKMSQSAIVLYVDNSDNMKTEFSWIYKSWCIHNIDYDLVVFHHPKLNLDDFPGIKKVPLDFDNFRMAKGYPFLKSHYFCFDEFSKPLRSYKYLLKTECDTFLTSPMKGFNPGDVLHVGAGDYSSVNTIQHIKQCMDEFGIDALHPLHMTNIGASLLGKTHIVLTFVANQAICTELLLKNKFNKDKGDWKSRWFKGTASMYGGEMAFNSMFAYQHAIFGLLDFRCWSCPIPSSVLHIHAWHMNPKEGWSKHAFHRGEYKDKVVNHDMIPKIASDYCHFIATYPLERAKSHRTFN